MAEVRVGGAGDQLASDLPEFLGPLAERDDLSRADKREI